MCESVYGCVIFVVFLSSLGDVMCCGNTPTLGVPWLVLLIIQVACRLAVSRSLGDMQFKGERLKEKGDGGADGKAPLKRKEQLVSPEPAVESIRLASRDRVVIVASGTAV